MLLTEPTYNRTPYTTLAWRARNLSQKTYGGYHFLTRRPCSMSRGRRQRGSEKSAHSIHKLEHVLEPVLGIDVPACAHEAQPTDDRE